VINITTTNYRTAQHTVQYCHCNSSTRERNDPQNTKQHITAVRRKECSLCMKEQSWTNLTIRCNQLNVHGRVNK